jgi:hypothetical protein
MQTGVVKKKGTCGYLPHPTHRNDTYTQRLPTTQSFISVKINAVIYYQGTKMTNTTQRLRTETTGILQQIKTQNAENQTPNDSANYTPKFLQ